jgi:hypothetical protein
VTFITKRHLSRRTLLRGAGATLALPFLDSMVGAQTLLKNTAASPKPRLGCIYVPHGATMYKWTPATEGRGFALSESLSPLEKYRDRMIVVSNLFHASATGADAGAEHARSAAIYLSGGRPQKNAVRVGVTMDQIAAEHISQDTPLPSLELGIEEVSLSCGAGYGCAYFNTISASRRWRCREGCPPPTGPAWTAIWTTSGRSNDASRPFSIGTHNRSTRSASPMRR